MALGPPEDIHTERSHLDMHYSIEMLVCACVTVTGRSARRVVCVVLALCFEGGYPVIGTRSSVSLRACTWSSQMLSIHVTGADKTQTTQINWLLAQFSRTSNQLVHSGRVGRAPSAVAANHGSRSNRNNKRDLDHLCLDPVDSDSVRLRDSSHAHGPWPCALALTI